MYPLGSENTKLNVWLAPLPEEGVTETACGPWGTGVEVGDGVAMGVGDGVGVGPPPGGVWVEVGDGVAVGVAVPLVGVGVAVAVAVTDDVGTSIAITRPPRRIYSFEGCGVCASVAAMATARKANSIRIARGAETSRRNFEINREIFTVPTFSIRNRAREGVLPTNTNHS